MYKVCDYCYNLLYPTYYNNVLTFKCMSCQIPYKALAEDTLRYARTKETDLEIYKKILSKVKDDPVVIKKNISCPECPGDIVKQAHIGEDMTLYNVCVRCGHNWIN